MRSALGLLLCVLFLGALASATTVNFSDNFNSGPSPQWGNQDGNWQVTFPTAGNGVYNTQNPSNSPTTFTLLPYDLTDFTVNVDVNGASDGGIWLRSDANRNNGILLVIGGNSHSGTGFYFHEVTGGSFSGEMAAVSGLFSQGDDIHVKVVVSGDTYSVYFDGASTPATTLTTSLFSDGRTGLYDFTGSGTSFGRGPQSFDNFTLTGQTVSAPEPATLTLLAAGLLCIRRRYRNY